MQWRPQNFEVFLACFAAASAPACAGSDNAHLTRAVAAPPSSTTESPSALSDVPVPQPTVIRLVVGGDLVPHRPRLLAPKQIAEALAPMSDFFAQVDAAVMNYETSTGDPSLIASRAMSLAVTPAWMAELPRVHVRHITVANNHACDLGSGGLDATLETARKLGVTVIGADPKDPWAAQTLLERDGHRVCAVGWTTFVNVLGCARSGKLAIANYSTAAEARITDAVAKAREGGCDAVVAIFHAGEEYAPQIAGAMRQARKAAESGADAVVIHHPHVPAPVQVFLTDDGRRVPVFASAGNVVSNQGESWNLSQAAGHVDAHAIAHNAWTRLGLLADLSWNWPAGAPAGKRGAMSWSYHLLWTDNGSVHRRGEEKSPIVTHVLDPVLDGRIAKRLAADRHGPATLFLHPCWVEETGKRCL